MTFTKEWLQKAISDIETMRDEIPFGLDEDGNNTLAALKLALAGVEAEPVSDEHIRREVNVVGNTWVQCSKHAFDKAKTEGKIVRELYERPQPLTTSERAELENYRNAQQVVPAQDDADPRDEFEKVFPIPAHVSRCGKGYAVHEYNAWSSHDYVKKWDGWNACRAAIIDAAMLQAKAEQVDKMPDDFDFDRFNDVVWLEAVASNPHMHSLTTSTIAMVALELNRKLADGNSPVIPDGWVMVPVEPTAEMYDAGDRQLATKQVWDAMIAAAPQQG